MTVHTHAKEHTQRHKAKRDRAPHGKDAKLLAAVAAGEKPTATRKRVFRPVLTSPFAISWPRISKADGDVVLHTLLEILCEGEAPKRAKPNLPENACIVGVNAVTRSLEGWIQAARERASPPGPPSTAPRFVFVCAADMDPPVLVSHVPMLVGAYNAICAGKRHVEKDDDTMDRHALWEPAEFHSPETPAVSLVPVPEGSEFLLSTAMCVRRLSALLVTLSMPSDKLARLELCVKHALGVDAVHQGYRVSWLDHVDDVQAPHVKHVASSAPAVKKKKKALN